jgi:hypothetical protein
MGDVNPGERRRGIIPAQGFVLVKVESDLGIRGIAGLGRSGEAQIHYIATLDVVSVCDGGRFAGVLT